MPPQTTAQPTTRAPAPLETPYDPRPDWAWLDRNRASKRYRGRWVAVHQGRVVAQAPDPVALAKLVEGLGLDRRCVTSYDLTQPLQTKNIQPDCLLLMQR